MKHLLSAFVLLFMVCISAKGEEVTFGLRGIVHELDGEFSYFSGQPFEIIFSFERTTDDADPDNPESGSYIGAIKSGTLTVFAGSRPLQWVVKPDGSHNGIEVKNLHTGDSFRVGVSVSGSVNGNEIPAYFLVELMDSKATAISKDELPASVDIQSFDQRNVHLTFIGIRKFTYSTLGVITSGGAPIRH